MQLVVYLLISAWVREWAQTPPVQSNFEGKKRRKTSTEQVWNSLGRVTGKSLSEALIFASTNPQYDVRLFIELQVQYLHENSKLKPEENMCTERLSYRNCYWHSEQLLYTTCSHRVLQNEESFKQIFTCKNSTGQKHRHCKRKEDFQMLTKGMFTFSHFL